MAALKQLMYQIIVSFGRSEVDGDRELQLTPG
jgi:hypothetical protein